MKIPMCKIVFFSFVAPSQNQSLPNTSNFSRMLLIVTHNINLKKKILKTNIICNQIQDLCSGSTRCLAEYSYSQDRPTLLHNFNTKKNIKHKFAYLRVWLAEFWYLLLEIFCINLWQLYRYMTFYLQFFALDFGIPRIWQFAPPFVLKISLDLG